MHSDKIIVGSQEWCALPTLSIPAIKARVDSGAKTSALHATNIQPFKRANTTWVSFEVHPLQDNGKVLVRCEAPVIDQRVIKSSTGSKEKRYVIMSQLSIGDHSWEIELTLTNRFAMGFRMLLGREAMMGRILVDPDDQCCLGDHSKEAIDSFYPAAPQSQGGLKIGLLASNPNLYSNRRIIEAAEKRGHQIQFFDVKRCFMKLDAETPEVHYKEGNVLNNLDAVIPRIRPSVTFYGCALTRHFESIGIYPLNTADSISHSRDKLYSMQLLLKSGISIPTSGFANSPQNTNDLIEMVGGAPLIIKLLEGTQGTGVVLAETKKASESVINAFKSLNANLLVQEFIKEANGKDLRCFVINGRVVAAIERTAAEGEFRANLHKGGTAKLVKITQEERKLAVKAAKCLGLAVAGVDLIRSKRGALLLEVNSSPGLEGVEAATNIDVAGLMIEAIEKKLSWPR